MEVLMFLFVLAGGIYLLAKSLNKPKPIQWAQENTKEEEDNYYYFKPSHSSTQMIKALLYLGKADGQLRDKEVELIINYLVRSQPEHVTTHKWYLANCIKEMKPFSTEEYQEFVYNLDITSLQNYQTWMKSIFETQKKNHPYEDILLNDLQKAIDSKL